MTAWFVSRHPGAVAWARQQGFGVDRFVAHLDPALVAPGDLVMGSLPVHHAAAVCRRAARYLHLSLDIPAEWRGRELSVADLAAFGARLEEFVINRVE